MHVPKVIEARDEIQMAPESRESPRTPPVLMFEDVVRKECEFQQEIDRLQPGTYKKVRRTKSSREVWRPLEFVDLWLPTRT